MNMELTRAILFVRDMTVMAGFYRDQLGLRPVPEGASAEWMEFETGGARLALHAIPEDIAAGLTGDGPDRVREETPIKLVFRVADVAAERSRLLARGARMLETRPWGACDGVDPEGNVFQIAGR